MKKIRLLVVDDSPVARSVLRQVLERDGDIQIVAEADGVEAACDLAPTVQPDVITMDVQMPGVGGLEGISRLMARAPSRILVVTGLPAGPGSPLVFHALERGALDVAVKPLAGDMAATAALRATVRTLAAVPPVQRLPPRLVPATATPRGSAREPALVIGIVASTGGPSAIARVIRELPADLEACVAVVQHLPAGLETSFLTFLEQSTSLEVRVAKDMVTPRAGTVVVALPGRHLVASVNGLEPVEGEPVDGHCPSGTALFESLASVWGPRSAGVVLSGSGNDGARGLLAIHGAGGATFVQDVRTATLPAMPRAAALSGASPAELSLADLPGALTAHVRLHATPAFAAQDLLRK